jgi:murein DD-endopeptidase MepM/ murein hydrolase activator NlpD
MIGAVIALVTIVAGCYQPPIESPVIDPFREPSCSFCPGNRGLEYEPASGTPVAAVAPGVVTFSGLVAGVRYLVVDQSDGRTATYGRLATTGVGAGASVRARDTLGTTTDRFFFGLRVDGRYIDPAPYLGVVHYRPRLVPVDGTRRRPPPPPTMRCTAARVGERVGRR